MRLFLFSFCLWLTTATIVEAQVSINPTAITIHQGEPIEELTVFNSSSEPMEVSLSMEFGYPDVNAQGVVFVNYNDNEAAGLYGLDAHLRIFPRQFVLEPGKRQIVRIQALPMPDRAPGVYWTRVKVASNELSKDQAALSAAGFSSRVTYRIQQNIGVFYRNGDVSTGLRMESVSTAQRADTLDVTQTVIRTGNSPYLGHLRMRLLASDGSVAAEHERPFSVYFDRTWTVPIDVSAVPTGVYTLEITTQNRRADMPDSDIVVGDALRVTRIIRVD